jgi:FkbM family methyltransferase
MSHSDLADNALNEVAMFKEMLESRGISPARVWDIGANVGLYALAIRHHFPNALIEAFEPVESNLSVLRENIHTNGAEDVISVHAVGIGETDERVPLGLPKHREADNTGLYSRFYGDEDFGKEIVGDCQIVSGQTALQMCETPPDIVKIDVEGAEISVLRALSGVLPAVKAVIVEVAEDPRFPRPGDVNALLLSAGFSSAHPALDFVAPPGKRGRKAYNRLWARSS